MSDDLLIIFFEDSATGLEYMMARYCVAFESMKLFLSMKGDEKLGDLVVHWHYV